MNADLIASALLGWLGLLAFCRRSAIQRKGLGLPPIASAGRRAYTLTGLGLLALSWLLAIKAETASFGTVIWLSQTGLLGLLLACSLPFASALVWRSLWPALLAATVFSIDVLILA